MKKIFTCLCISLFLISDSVNSQTCTCTGNLVNNPGFETGITGWTVTGGTLTTGSSSSCGSFSGDFGVTNTSSNSVSQNIAVGLAPGTVVNAGVYAGVKTIATTHKTGIYFYDSSMVLIAKSEITISQLYTALPGSLKYYNWSGIVPAGTKFTNIGFTATGDTIKTDQWCVTTAVSGTGIISDKIWYDANANGIQDASETKGMGNLVVNLKNTANTIMATTISDLNGNYTFSNLAAGDYKVVFPVLVSGFELSPVNAGFNDSTDSDADKITGESQVITITGTEIISNVDAGYLPTTMQIGNRIAYDADNNGSISGEGGLYNVKVNLYKDDNNDDIPDSSAMATVNSDGNGGYLFANLKPGNYIVGVVIPLNMKSSDINGGDPDNNINSDDNGQVLAGNEIRGLAITLTGGAEISGTELNNNQTYDFGFVAALPNLLTLGNDIFIDHNGNGKKDGADYAYGSSGFYVNLYADNNEDGIADSTAPVAATATNSAGNFIFYALNPGKYFAQIMNTPSWMTLIQNNGGDPDNDIDNDNNGISQNLTVGTIKGGTITLAANTEPGASNSNNTYDFAVYKGNGLGDFVFADMNANGIQDAGESGIPNVTVNLRSTSGVLLASTITDATGKYAFYDPMQYINTVNYNIEFITPSGYVASPSNQGGDDAFDSDPVNGTILNAYVPYRTWNYTFDAGFVPAGSISNFVWNDVNKNCLQDGGEPGIAGKIVTLKNPGGDILATDTTDSNGEYLFDKLLPGNYIVNFGTVSGMDRVLNNVGVNNTINSKANPLTGNANVTIGVGENNTTIDAGYQPVTVLPVKQIVLMPLLNGNTVDVNWNTINETNTYFFEVERSYDGNRFETLERLYTLVPNGGNGMYHIKDNTPDLSANAVMYRIKVTDKDGYTSYSSVSVIRLKKNLEISVWPNPFISDIKVAYTASEASIITINVLDLNGKKLVNANYKAVKGNNVFSISNLSGLPHGMYIIELIDGKADTRSATNLSK